ncbi:unnamed protein product [Closterium sp. Yama58-4]|nr:unnamed protein product [Closterium sp. Yama58-4]
MTSSSTSRILQQWSYGWDNYTSAPFVAIADDDIIFHLKVTAFLLFNLSGSTHGNQSPMGRPYLIGSKDQGYHRPSTDFRLGLLPPPLPSHLQVTPFLLFNLSGSAQANATSPHGRPYLMGSEDQGYHRPSTDSPIGQANQSPMGRPYLIGSKDQGYHRPSTDFLLGRRAYAGNFMVQLPLLLPRGAVRGYREAVGAAHPKMAGGYDEAVQWWAEHGGQYRDQIAHTVMGNYLWNNEKDKMEFAMEWTDHTPIPRVGVHLPYTNLFKDLGGSPVDPASKLNLSFVQTAAHYQRETICHSLPPGSFNETRKRY